jgi:hypothetical protein
MSSIFGKLLKREPIAPPEPNRFDEPYAGAIGAAANGDFQQAIRLYDQAIAVDPSHADAYYKRGNAQRSLGRLDAAIASYDEAIGRNPGHAYAYCNRGTVQQALGLTAEALTSYDRALALDPTDAMAHYNRALSLQDCCRWREALASYDQALAIDPAYADAHYNRSLALLFLGDFESGWRAYEWRWKNARRLNIGEALNCAQPLWLGGESIAGKRLLLHSEAGLGDTIQFCRYAPLVAASGATVILQVQAPLVGILKSLEGVSALISTGGPLPPFHCHCPLMSLPLALKTTAGTIPASPNYLHGDPASVARWRTLLGEPSRRRVGLVWSGNLQNTIDRRRSIRLSDWMPHLPPDFQYFCLQKDVREEDREVLETSENIFSFDDDSMNFADTAALCECMDVVVSVDTSVAHLSGALGRPTWILLPHVPDWRWMLDREDTPWYPTAKLYRQKAAGDWNEVFARVAADLRLIGA